MVLVTFTWEELEVPIQGLFLQRHIFLIPLQHKAGLIGVALAAQSKKGKSLSNIMFRYIIMELFDLLNDAFESKQAYFPSRVQMLWTRSLYDCSRSMVETTHRRRS